MYGVIELSAGVEYEKKRGAVKLSLLGRHRQRGLDKWGLCFSGEGGGNRRKGRDEGRTMVLSKKEICGEMIQSCCQSFCNGGESDWDKNRGSS